MALSLQQAELNLLEKSAGDYMYYRQPNGNITVAPIGKGELRMFAYIREGWTPLREYGRFDYPRRYYAENPFEVLFMRGGAKEMSVAQIQELGFHFNPPLVPACGLAHGSEHEAVTKTGHHVEICWRRSQPVEFPQLAGLTLDGEFTCEICSHEKIPSKAALDQHTAVMHAPEKSNVALGKTLSEGMGTAMAQAIAIMAEQMAKNGRVDPDAVVAAVVPKSDEPYVCGACGKGFDTVQGVGMHVRGQHPKAKESDDGEA